MEVIAQSVVDGVAFDKTITCTIVDDSDKENGRYRVTDGSSKFIAYSETKTFRNKEVVYVTVPNGNFGEQKIIIGKKTEIEEEPFNYVRPFDNFLACTNNIINEINIENEAGEEAKASSEIKNRFRLVANSDIQEKVIILQKPKKDNEINDEYKQKSLNRFLGGFTRLGIRISFQSLLAKENLKSGNYGIILKLVTLEDDVAEGNNYYYEKKENIKDENLYENDIYVYDNIDKNYIKFEGKDISGLQIYKRRKQQKEKPYYYILDTSDMLGNPYAFEVPVIQEKLFDISNINEILEASITFFQKKGSFIKKNDTGLTVEKIGDKEVYNLFAPEIELYLGFDISEIKDEYVGLFTFDSMNYQHHEDILQNKKEIQLCWAHKNEDKIQVFNKNNLESWYDNLFEEDGITEKKGVEYSFKLDESQTQIENRIYYNVIPTQITNDIVRYYDYQINQTNNNQIRYQLDSSNPFYPINTINSKEQYFEYITMPLQSFINNDISNFFKYDKKFDYNMIKDFKGEIKTRTRKIVSYSQMQSEDFIRKNTFYSYDGEYFAPASILTSEDFDSNKIYYYDCFDSKEFSDNIFESKDNNLFITLYYPISKKSEDFDFKLNHNYIFKANFTTSNENNNTGNYVLNIKPVENNFIYKPNTYFYKQYKINDFEIRWYRYELGAPAADEYCGLYWTRIPNRVANTVSTYIDADEPSFNCTLIPDAIHNKTEQIKVIILINQEDGTKKPYYSNVLTFENKSEVASVPTIMQEMALRLKINDKTQGNYLLYDESNHIIDREQSTQQRSLTVLFDKENFNSLSALNNAEKVTWTFPIKNTMLNIDTVNTEGTYLTVGDDSTYAVIELEQDKNEYKLYYSISDTFGFNKNNNTITCTIVKDGETFSTTQEFTFGQNGSNGSDYTLALDLLTSDGMITIQPSENVIGFNKLKEEDKYDETKEYYEYVVNEENKQIYKKIDKEKFTEEEFKKRKQELYIKANSLNEAYNSIDKETDLLWLDYKNNVDEIINNQESSNKIQLLQDIQNNFFVENNGMYIPLYNIFKDSSLTANDFQKYLNNNNIYVANNLAQVYAYDESQNIIEDEKETSYISLKTNNPVEENAIRATLYDQNGNLVPGDYKVKWSWTLTPDAKNLFSFSSEETSLGENVILLQKSMNNAMNTICIATATLTGFGDYDLVAHLPIPLRANYGVTRYQGPDRIIYSTTGIPNYYKDEINLFYNDTKGNEQKYPVLNNMGSFKIVSSKEFFTDEDKKKEEQEKEKAKVEKNNFMPELKAKTSSIENIYWIIRVDYENKILYYGEKEEEKLQVKYDKINKIYYFEYGNGTKFNGKFYFNNKTNGLRTEINLFNSDKQDGSLIEIPNNFYYIVEKQENPKSDFIAMVPKATYIDGVSPFAIQYVYDKKVLFTQPILNIQNRYFSSTINRWDGSLSVDENNNTILAKMIGAGRKDSDNTFTGVVMGDWTGNVNANDGTNISLANKPGLYGFHKGETSFGFTSEGIGFIGKASRGRILLDGNESVITSANWVMNSDMDDADNHKGNEGLYMKIDDGFILLKKKQYEEERNGKTYTYNPIIKLNALASGGYQNADDSNLSFNSNLTNLNPAPGEGNDSDYPFVIAKDKKNFTKIGWNGNIYLGGTHKDLENGEIQEGTGYISLNAAAKKYPLDINSHFAVAWNGALTISKQNITGMTESAQNIISSDDRRITEDSSTLIEMGKDKNNNFYNDSSKLSGGQVYSKNQYDYSILNTSFHGLYATPDGDMYLSRKLVIGSNFSANAQGYLKAKSGLFYDCNANVFQVRYLPSTGANAQIDFKESKVPDYEEQTSSNLQADYNTYGAKIGSMGWLQGKRDIEKKNENGEPVLDDKGNPTFTTVATYNLGFKSEAHCGILLDSSTNVRIDSADIGGTYFNGAKLQANLTNEINLFQFGSNPNAYSGIKIFTKNELKERSSKRISIQIEKNSTNVNSFLSGNNNINSRLLLDNKKINEETSTSLAELAVGLTKKEGQDDLQISSRLYMEEKRFELSADGGNVKISSQSTGANESGSSQDLSIYTNNHIRMRSKNGILIGKIELNKDGGVTNDGLAYLNLGYNTEPPFGNHKMTKGAALNSGNGPLTLISPNSGYGAPYILLGGEDGESSIHISTQKDIMITTSGQAESNKITVLAGDITFDTPLPDNQHGIYARFA